MAGIIVGHGLDEMVMADAGLEVAGVGRRRSPADDDIGGIGQLRASPDRFTW